MVFIPYNRHKWWNGMVKKRLSDVMSWESQVTCLQMYVCFINSQYNHNSFTSSRISVFINSTKVFDALTYITLHPKSERQFFKKKHETDALKKEIYLRGL